MEEENSRIPNNAAISPLCERLKQYKFTTPPWKETFRKDCMERLRQNRRRLIDKNRQNYTIDLLDEGWTKLREQYIDMDAYLVIYDEIRKEMDEEAERIFHEYELSCNFPVTNEELRFAMDTDNAAATAGTLDLICSTCRKTNNYAMNGHTPVENGNLVSLCDCGHLVIDRRTKVLEPSLSFHDIVERLNVYGKGHASICDARPYMGTIDGGINDGTHLIIFCQDCGMKLVIW